MSFTRAGVVFLLLTALSGCLAKDQTATVRIENRTGRTISPGNLILKHKYSDDYDNDFTFEETILDGKTSQTKVTVQYKTGITHPGEDWWHMTWVTDDNKTYINKADGLRCALDWAGQWLTSRVLGLVTSRALLLASCGFPPIIGCVTGGVARLTARLLAALISEVVAHHETKCGYKSCTLREGDANGIVTIILSKDKITVKPPQSGSCDFDVTLVSTAPVEETCIRDPNPCATCAVKYSVKAQTTWGNATDFVKSYWDAAECNTGLCSQLTSKYNITSKSNGAAPPTAVSIFKSSYSRCS